MSNCLPSLTVPNPSLAGGLSLGGQSVSVPSFGLLCCHTPTITVTLPTLSLGASATLLLSEAMDPILAAVSAYIRSKPIPCLKGPPPEDEL